MRAQLTDLEIGCHQTDAAEQTARHATGERPARPQGIFSILRPEAPGAIPVDRFGALLACTSRVR